MVRRLQLGMIVLVAAALLATSCVPEAHGEGIDARKSDPAQTQVPKIAPPSAVAPPPTRTVGEVLGDGVVIMISRKSQQMHVFRNGMLWRSSTVSTGRRGKETPLGVFAVLQKKTFHRSNRYSNAPMPFMQRLTWDGIAIHAGHLPGYPASHGCIRIPREFASALFKITGATKTAVIVTDEPLPSGTEALALAQKSDAVVPINPDLLKGERAALARKSEPAGERLPAARTIAAPAEAHAVAAPSTATAGKHQTIQLVAALSSGEAETHWQTLSAHRPEVRDMRVAIIPAMVNGTQYYRLRASAPDAHARCSDLKRAGFDCFAIR